MKVEDDLRKCGQEETTKETAHSVDVPSVVTAKCLCRRKAEAKLEGQVDCTVGKRGCRRIKVL